MQATTCKAEYGSWASWRSSGRSSGVVSGVWMRRAIYWTLMQHCRRLVEWAMRDECDVSWGYEMAGIQSMLAALSHCIHAFPTNVNTLASLQWPHLDSISWIRRYLHYISHRQWQNYEVKKQYDEETEKMCIVLQEMYCGVGRGGEGRWWMVFLGERRQSVWTIEEDDKGIENDMFLWIMTFVCLSLQIVQ